MSRIVSDTGPIIPLEKLSDGFSLVRLLYSRILIPESVLQELADGLGHSPKEYMEKFGVADLFSVAKVELSASERNPNLAPAETEAISLAAEEGLPLLIEETFGRRIARERGLEVPGIAGLIIRARKKDLISKDEAVHKLGELFSAGRINKKIHMELASRLRDDAS